MLKKIVVVILALFDVFCLLGLIGVLFESGKDKGADIMLCLVFIVPISFAIYKLIKSIRNDNTTYTKY